jgi:AcrR family transcriptional regulator
MGNTGNVEDRATTRAGSSVKSPRRRRSRRTQEERSSETRAKVIAAATDCVAELGFRGATMTAIAERAGVTWGALQHHYGDKDAILDGVLHGSLERLEEELGALRATAGGVPERVRAVVRKARELIDGPSYRAFVEIQLNRGRGGSAATRAHREWSRAVAASLRRAWRGAFGGLGLRSNRLDAGQRFAFMLLSGIAAESMLFPDVDNSRHYFVILEQDLLRLLVEDDRPA